MEYETLQELIVENLQFSQLYQACTTKYRNNPLVADLCSYSGLAERAETELEIPESYFNLPQSILPRKISALNRYLELRSYSILDEFTLVRRNPDTGALVGTYELWTAVQRAIEREDIVALEGYLPLLGEEAHKILRKEFYTDKKDVIRFLEDYYSLQREEEEEEPDLLLRVREGDETALREVLDNLSKYDEKRLLLYSMESGREDFFQRVLSSLSPRSVYLRGTGFSPGIITKAEDIKYAYPRRKLEFRPAVLKLDERQLVDAALYSKIYVCIAHVYLTTVEAPPSWIILETISTWTWYNLLVLITLVASMRPIVLLGTRLDQ